MNTSSDRSSAPVLIRDEQNQCRIDRSPTKPSDPLRTVRLVWNHSHEFKPDGSHSDRISIEVGSDCRLALAQK